MPTLLIFFTIVLVLKKSKKLQSFKNDDNLKTYLNIIPRPRAFCTITVQHTLDFLNYIIT